MSPRVNAGWVPELVWA